MRKLFQCESFQAFALGVFGGILGVVFGVVPCIVGGIVVLSVGLSAIEIAGCIRRARRCR